MRALALALTLSLAGVLGACTPRHDPAVPDPAHNSRNALDWAGTYEGITPCADCPGIKTRLTLHKAGRFELSTQYLDRQVSPQTVSGQFSWNSAGSAITLDAAGQGQQFQVGEGRLLQLNRDGSTPGWNATQWVLTMQSPR